MQFSKNNLLFEPLERIEFGFVFLPDDAVLKQLHDLSAHIFCLLQDIEKRAIPTEWGTYVNQSVRLPHLSIGHYGILGCELPILINIVSEVALKTPVVTQIMQSELSVLDDYIFFDVVETFLNVNPCIRETYIKLRTLYMEKIHTKFQKAHVLFSKKQLANDLKELALINDCFQNWGTPEDDRMRPHFTMHYHPPFVVEKMKQVLRLDSELRKKIDSLSEIKLTRIGIVHLDAYGNPVEKGLLYACPLVD